MLVGKTVLAHKTVINKQELEVYRPPFMGRNERLARPKRLRTPLDYVASGEAMAADIGYGS